VDLGQRDAGAFARLSVFSRKPEGSSRFIGKTGDKSWYAKVSRQGLLRLPGEDARAWRAASKLDPDEGPAFREELFGDKGRSATLAETEDASALLLGFEIPEDGFMPEGWRQSLSFPEQNDKLLFAARRALSRVRRLHRWAWFLEEGKRPDAAFDEILECDDPVVAPPATVEMARSKDRGLKRDLHEALDRRQKTLVHLLERLANRIVPLRGRSWRWTTHPDKADCFRLCMAGPAIPGVMIRGQRGLSMKRIEQLTELRKRLQSLNQTLRRKAGCKAPLRRDDSIPDCCPDLLEKIDRMKEQRINQTAHMILAEALGLRLRAPKPDKKQSKHECDLHGQYEKVASPVDFIVIENLSRYLTSQGRAPRENSRLMKWCHREVRQKLKMLCEIFFPPCDRWQGKDVHPLLEAPAAYSSRFCSRSGVAGFRAVEVTRGFENGYRWKWLKDKVGADGKPSAEAKHIAEVAQMFNTAENGSGKSVTLLVPMAGGPIFVPITDEGDARALAPKVVQADINAAINIGLRAIGDPLEWSIHQRLRTRRDKKGLFCREKRRFGADVGPAVEWSDQGDDKDSSENPNFFADFARCANWGKARLAGQSAPGEVPLASGKALWGAVKSSQWERCLSLNHKRLQALTPSV
jgi:hypothetical protein